MRSERDGGSRRLGKPRVRGGLTSEERHRLLCEAASRIGRGFSARGNPRQGSLETEQELEERRPPGH